MVFNACCSHSVLIRPGVHLCALILTRPSNKIRKIISRRLDLGLVIRTDSHPRSVHEGLAGLFEYPFRYSLVIASNELVRRSCESGFSTTDIL